MRSASPSINALFAHARFAHHYRVIFYGGGRGYRSSDRISLSRHSTGSNRPCRGIVGHIFWHSGPAGVSPRPIGGTGGTDARPHSPIRRTPSSTGKILPEQVAVDGGEQPGGGEAAGSATARMQQGEQQHAAAQFGLLHGFHQRPAAGPPLFSHSAASGKRPGSCPDERVAA